MTQVQRDAKVHQKHSEYSSPLAGARSYYAYQERIKTMNTWTKCAVGCSLVSLGIFLALTSLAEWAPDDWKLNYNPSNGAINPAISVAPKVDGEKVIPYVVWQESNQIYSQQWNGASWLLMPGPTTNSLNIDPSRTAANPDVAVCDSLPNSPLAAWEEDDSSKTVIYIRIWNGSEYEDFGDNAGALNVSSDNGTDVALGVYNTVSMTVAYATWLDAGDMLYAARCPGIGAPWEYLPEGGASDALNRNDAASASSPDLAIATDIPYIVWSEGAITPGKDDIFVSRKSATANIWDTVGNSLKEGTPLQVMSPSIAIDSNDTPYVAWVQQEAVGIRTVRVKRWTGNWELIGSPVNDDTSSADNPKLAIGFNNQVYVSWQENIGNTLNIRVKQWDGSQWQPMNGSLNIITNEDASGPDIDVLNSADQNPFVTWTELQSPKAVFVKHWLTPTITPTASITPTPSITPTSTISPTSTATPTSTRPTAVMTSTPTSSPTSDAYRFIKPDQAAAYPLPASEKVTFIFQAKDSSGKAIIRVYNTNHRLVKELSLDAPQGQGKITWDVSRIAPGVYYYQVQVGNKKLKIEKMVIAR